MPKERTEEEIVKMSPLKVSFGTKEYQIPLLCVPEVPGWREKVRTAMAEIGALGVSAAALGTAFIAFPQKMVELVISYCPSQLSDESFKSASEEQLAYAFSLMVSVSFPYLRLLSLMNPISQASPLASETSTNSSLPNSTSPQIM